MKSTVSLPVDSAILLRLISQLRQLGGAQDVSEAINAAIAFWLDERAKLPAVADPAHLRGYQWKALFLPEGTVLRSWSYGEHNYARVEGDRIIHQGRGVTPNQFAQSFARSTRNAWSDLFVRRPGDKQFKLACLLRRELAQQETTAAPPAAPPQTDPASLLLAALLSHAAVSVNAPAKTTVNTAINVAAKSTGATAEPPSAPWRDSTTQAGWDLPERRHCRYRLEDVAFD